MSHEELTGVGISTELAGKERAVVVVRVVLHIHGVSSEGGQHLPQALPVIVILIQPRSQGNGGFRIRLFDFLPFSPGLLHQIGRAADIRRS